MNATAQKSTRCRKRNLTVNKAHIRTADLLTTRRAHKTVEKDKAIGEREENNQRRDRIRKEEKVSRRGLLFSRKMLNGAEFMKNACRGEKVRYKETSRAWRSRSLSKGSPLGERGKLTGAGKKTLF